MKNKKIIYIMVVAFSLIFISSYAQVPQEKDIPEVTLDISQMKNIGELAVLECYYNNVARLHEEDAEGILWWKKDMNMWIEYESIIKLGINVEHLQINIEANSVKIELPPIEVLSSESNFENVLIYHDDQYALPTAEQQTEVFEEIESKLQDDVINNDVLISQSHERVKKLITDYVTSVGELTNQVYEIEWL